jgi:predicted O-methyltransferase YrrM
MWGVMARGYAGQWANLFPEVQVPHTAEITPAARLLRNILTAGRVVSDHGDSLELHSHLPAGAGRMLQKIIHTLEASCTLEIGMAFGISTLYICDALANTPGARHIVIDPHQHCTDWRGIGLRHARLAGFDHLIDFRELPAHQALPDLEREGARVDFAFIDGWHTFDFVMVDLFLVDRLLRVGGVVVLDDAEWPGVRKACRYFITNRRYRVLECWEPEPRPRASRLLRTAICYAARLAPVARRPLRPEWSMPDEELGMTPACRCIALQKTDEDDGRQCFGHEEF